MKLDFKRNLLDSRAVRAIIKYNNRKRYERMMKRIRESKNKS